MYLKNIALFSFLFIVLIICNVGCQNKQRTIDSNLDQWELLTPGQTGLNFVNIMTENSDLNHLKWESMYNGGGVAAADFNNDGLNDLYFAGNIAEDRLYLNRGNLRFKDISQSAGISTQLKPSTPFGAINIEQKGWSSGVTIADVNGDNYLDIYVCKFGFFEEPEKRRNRLFINNGDLTFTEKGEEYGLSNGGFSIQASFLDFDKDGDLDMYLVNQPSNVGMTKRTYFNDRDKESESLDENTSDRLFENQNGSFVDISKKAGIENFAYGLSIACSDYNNDGWIDIYVTNDYQKPDHLWINQKNGTFKDEINERLDHVALYAMGCDAGDMNNDGINDILSVDMSAGDHYRSKTNMGSMQPEVFWQRINDDGYQYQYMFNTLQIGNGAGYFSDVAQVAGIGATDWSWTILASDLNNDRHKDIFITNGIRKDVRNNDYINYFKAKVAEGKTQFEIQELIDKVPSVKIANYVYENKGNLKFEDKTKDWQFDQKAFSHGVAYADLDNDGDLELVVNNMADPVFLYKNNTIERSKDANYLRVNLEGNDGNTSGLGAKVKLEHADGSIQYAEHSLTRGYLSASEDILHFGLDTINMVERITVIWPNNQIQILQSVNANQILTVKQTSDLATWQPLQNESIFESNKAKERIDFAHSENEYNDFEKEILLPHKQSVYGPKIAKGDVNGDGFEDLYFCGANGQVGALMLNKNNGTFEPSNLGAFKNDKIYEDQDALFFDADNDNDLDLYVASGGSEFKANSIAFKDRLYLNDGKGNFSIKSSALPTITSNSGSVRASDFDKDGDMDLFIGARVIPQQYPYSDESVLLENKGGKFTDVTKSKAADLLDCGIVNDAIWTDFDQDGDEDLMTAGEWTAIQLFENNNGQFTRTNHPELEREKGWWFSLTAVDIDNDGDDDYIAGNIGLNNKFHPKYEKPFNVYSGDLDNTGTHDVYLTKFDQDGVCRPVRGRQCSSQQMPFILEKFPTYHDFAIADIDKILGASTENSLKLEATTFSSKILINNNGSFEVKELPALAQISPIMGVVDLDFNGDGVMDIIIAGNMYDVEVETARYDAGYGLLMQGNGDGTFNPVSVHESGINCNQNTRDIALIKSGSEELLIFANNNEPVSVYSFTKTGNNQLSLATIK